MIKDLSSPRSRSMLKRMSNTYNLDHPWPRKRSKWLVVDESMWSEDNRTTPEERIEIATRNLQKGVSHLIRPDLHKESRVSIGNNSRIRLGKDSKLVREGEHNLVYRMPGRMPKFLKAATPFKGEAAWKRQLAMLRKSKKRP